MAKLRAETWGTEAYWRGRIPGYMTGTLSPRDALAARVVYVAVMGRAVVGLSAGHLTRRHQCDGELQWIDVIAAEQGRGIGGDLLRLLARWFVERQALRVCVDVQPTNLRARQFYARHGACDLKASWMVWEDIQVALGDS